MKLSELTNQTLEGMLRGAADAETLALIRNELRARGVAVTLPAGEQPPQRPRRHRFDGLNAGARRVRGEMNKTETAYAQLLDERLVRGEIVDWVFERVKLRLTDAAEDKHAIWFTGDFLSIDAAGQHYLDDVKGSGPDNDASIVRFRMCPTIWPHWTYRLVKKQRKADGGGWKVIEL